MIIALSIYLVFVNVVSFALFGMDKRRAEKHQWRTPEKTLLGITLIGGSAGALLGMRVFRHKTRKPLFMVVVPAALVAHIALVAYVVTLIN